MNVWRDETDKLGLSSLQKVTAVVRMLAYDVAGDAVNEYLRIGASTSLECLKTFCKGMNEIFSEQYLRQPTSEDVARLNAENSRRGFSGMLGSIDCMHWACKNYPAAWAGQYQSGHQKEPSIILQAVASKNLWIWHAYFGVSGCKNDINVPERSNLFLNLAKEEAPPVQFEVNENEYNMGDYLADDIYPSWAAFVKTIPRPLSQKQRIFAQYQEGVRKDVERAFGVLQARWHIDEREDILEDHDFPTIDDEHVSPNVVPSRDPTVEFNAFLERHVSIRNREMHHNLQKDLIEHI
ncbi:uncharacterized protein [Henckelia pumila]|uniref:uncharacterized protein n=1 Tax=Henckelia pumila TaxID=405737 RepID=UPI003C6E96EF